MKKSLLLLLLSVSFMVGAQAQKLNKLYDLYYIDNNGKTLFTTGVGFRNDTLFIDLSAPINVVAVRKEGDTTYATILLRPFREMKFNALKKPAINVKKDTTQKSKPKANIKDPGKKVNN